MTGTARRSVTATAAGVAGGVVADASLGAGGAVATPRPAASAQVSVTAVTTASAKVRLRGSVRLPAGARNTAAVRRGVRVAIELTGASGKPQRYTTAIDASRRYDVRKATVLRGSLAATVRVRYRGKTYGAARRLTVRGIPKPAALTTPTTVPTTTPAPAIRAPLVNGKLLGLFRLDAGQATAGTDGKSVYGGTYFRMIQPGGQIDRGPFLENGTSSAPDKTYTFLRPGTEGGLRTDRYQPGSSPLYDANDVLTQTITQREPFFGPLFTVYTEPEDDQAKLPDPVPEIVNTDGRLSGQTTAWVANWNRQGVFNQGSPKPDGGSPGKTTAVRGTIDPATGRYTLEWSSEIVGGPFNAFGGYWHLEGTFEPAS